MSNYDTFILYAAEYGNLSDAEADYDAVKDLYYELGLVDTFDAAVIEKKDDGTVKIVKKHEQPTRKGVGVQVPPPTPTFPYQRAGADLLRSARS